MRRHSAATCITRAALIALVLAAAFARPAAAQHAEDAAAAWNAGEHDRARELYGARVAADSTDVQALHRLGLLLAWNREFGRAVPLLERVVAIAPSRDARLDLARVLSWSGRFAAAEVMYADVLASDPDDAAAHIGLSQLLRWRGQPRAALQHARTAVRLRPGDRDALEQLAWAEAAFAPRVAPTFSAETDSDENRLYTAALAASGHVDPRVALMLNAYLRRAEGPTPTAAGEAARETWSVTGGARIEVGAGWSVSGTGGVVERTGEAGGSTGVYRAALATPAWLPVTGTAGFARSALDATADLMARDVVTDEASLAVGAQLARALRVDAGVSMTRFRGQTVNDRWLGRLGLESRVTPALRIRPRATAFRFDETVHEGYFAPDEYVLGELGIGVDRYGERWSFTGELAPGAQRIGSAGEMKGALSGRARVGYTVAPGREIGVGVSFSNLGMERFQAGSAGYRYQAAVISAAWGF